MDIFVDIIISDPSSFMLFCNVCEGESLQYVSNIILDKDYTENYFRNFVIEGSEIFDSRMSSI